MDLKSGSSRMHRGSRVAEVVAVVTGALVTSAALATAETSQAKTVSVKKWATSVCMGVGEWEHRLATLDARGELADPTAGKAAISKFLKWSLQATDKLAKQVKIAGVPLLQNCKAIEAGLVSSAKSLRAAYATARSGAAALPTTDASAFSIVAKTLATQLQTASAGLTSSLADAAKCSPGGSLDTALTTSKACAGLI